jgi:hypothetical protein
MARKVDKPATPSAGDPPALEAVAALVPEVKATIAGRELVFREYAVFEGYEVAYLAQDFITALHAQVKAGGLKYAHVRRLIGPHQDVVVRIAALSADVDEAWVRGLDRNDADQFFASWFVANAGFFVREVLFDIQQAQADAAMDLRSTASSSGLPGQDLGTSASSSAARSAN